MPDQRHYFMEGMAEFFAAWELRVAFLDELAASGHEQEALLLASCYIEALGHELFPKCEGGKRAFTRVLIEHGGNAVFAGHHSRALKDWLSQNKAKWASVTAGKLGHVLDGLVGTLLSKEELVLALQSHLESAEMQHLTPQLWHATYAAIVYTDTRSQAVHHFPPGNVVFSVSTFAGKPVPTINYPLLAPALKAVLGHCKQISFDSCLYFGHDPFGLLRAKS